MEYLIEIIGDKRITFMDMDGEYKFDGEVFLEYQDLYINYLDCENKDEETVNEYCMEVSKYKNHLIIPLLINTIHDNRGFNRLYLYKDKLYFDREMKLEYTMFPLLLENLNEYDKYNYSKLKKQWEEYYEEVKEILKGENIVL